VRRMLFRCGLAAALGLSGLATGLPLLPIHTSWATAPVVTEAKALYDAANFTDAVTSLRNAITTGELKGADALAAKELLGRCLVKSGDRLQAKEMFKSLLRQKGNYRLDAQNVPPDEIEVFTMAQHEVTAEQIETGHRVPASLSLSFGTGSGDNKNMGELPAAGGGPNKFDATATFGGSVRFPLSPRLSIELEIQRFRATAADTFPETQGGRFEVTELPISVSLYHATLVHPKWRVNTFIGAGAVTPASSTLFFFLTSTERASISDEKTGFYGHAGLEGEYLASSRFAITGRLLGRVARASGFYAGSPLKLWGTTPLADRKVDFSGFGAQLGLRAYIGY
jgi:hypothetical protein